jgi:hypothetical protein
MRDWTLKGGKGFGCRNERGSYKDVGFWKIVMYSHRTSYGIEIRNVVQVDFKRLELLKRVLQ